MKKEKWKNITGYEGLYKVSNLGNVKSLAKKRKGRNSKKDLFVRNYSEIILKCGLCI